MPRFTFVSEGNPRRRLRIGLKGVFVVVIVVLHSAPSSLKLELLNRHANGGEGSALPADP